MALFQRLNPTPRERVQAGAIKTIICDCSGSMETDDGKGRRIDLLRQALEMIPDLHGIKLIAFNNYASVCEEVGAIPEPFGSTDLARAFVFVRQFGSHHVLITDGVPDSEKAALQAAVGQTFDIVYVGPEPMPRFLTELANVTRGSLQIGKINDPKLLSQTVSGLLEHRKG